MLRAKAVEPTGESRVDFGAGPLQVLAVPPPPSIPDHELLAILGRGSYGEVWLARNVLGTLRAVKIVRRSEFRSARPFEREFAGIQRFEPVSRLHEGLVDILQVGRNDPAGYFYYVMELADAVPGSAHGSDSRLVPRTFATDLAGHGRLSPAECAERFHSLALALAHLHEAGLVHRDIKPANLIFVGGKPKFADIGLVAAVDEEGSYVGTEGFIPPEGAGTIAADIFSLGKVLYEAATGRDRLDFPALPEDLKPGESGDLLELNAVIVKACAPLPADRYPTARALAADLDLLRHGRSVKRKRQAERRRSWMRRVMLPALGVLALLYGVAAGRRRTGDSPNPRASSPIQPPAEGLTLARRLREEARPGWRAAAWEAVTRAATTQPSSQLRQEAILILASGDLRPLAWQMPGPPAPLLVDLARERYVTADPDGIVRFRAMADHAELWSNDQGIGPVRRFLDFSGDGHWLTLQDRTSCLRFRRCDPKTGAWVWTTREDPLPIAVLDRRGGRCFFSRPDRAPRLASTASMASQQSIELPGPALAASWSPDDHAIAVLMEDPPALAVVDEAGQVAWRVGLPSKPVALAWNPAGEAVWVAGTGGLWRVRTRAEPELVPGSPRDVRSLAFDATGRWLALATSDSLGVWEAPGHRWHAVASMQAHRVDFAPDASRLAAYDASGTRVTLWEFVHEQELVRWTTNAVPTSGNLPIDGEGVRFKPPEVPEGILLPSPLPLQRAALTADGSKVLGSTGQGPGIEWDLRQFRERLVPFGLGW